MASLLCAAAFAQTPAAAPAESRIKEMLEARDSLLAEHGLLDALAAGLRSRLTKATGEEKTRLAESLSKLYAKMLTSAPTSERRREIEDACRALLKAAPEAESPALRLTIAQAQYLPIEELVERRAMKMTQPADDAEAERVLRAVRPVFDELSARLTLKAKTLKQKKDQGTASDAEAEALQGDIDETNSLRSRACFLAGWSAYYMGALTGDKHAATAALEHFGGVLNALPGQKATIDRVAEGNLRYPHVAKAAIGCALACSLSGDAVGAQRWLELVEHAEDVPQEVTASMLRRKMAICAADDRWADARIAVLRTRQPEPGQPVTPLPLADARLLAVISLDALNRADLRPGLRATAEELAQIGLGDLVLRGEVGHVMSLVNIYGTSLVGKDGFINNYVRALRSYDDANASHAASQGKPDTPSKTPQVINAFHAAASQFESAQNAPDAEKFPAERTRAMLLRGLSLFMAGSLEPAADVFERAFDTGTPDKQRSDALWYGIVALNTAVREGKPSLRERRERMATLFIKTFPNSPQAVELLVGRVNSGAGGDTRDLETLLNVPPESPMRETARRVAARLLYAQFKRTTGEDREFVIIRFAEAAEEALKAQFARATANHDAPSREAADQSILLARQLTDALLSAKSPDAARAESALTSIESVAAYHAIDLKSLGPEITFNRLRIAWATNNDTAAQKHLDLLRAEGGPFANEAEKTLYRRALDSWTASPQNTAAARRVVSSGSRVLLIKELGASALSGVRDRVADAAFAVWRIENDASMRDIAARTDEAQLDSGARTASSLRRLAAIKEAMGDAVAALALWRELIAGSDDGSEQWYEATYETLRILSDTSPKDAVIGLRQHQLLHPKLGPPPWDAKFTELATKLGESEISPSNKATPVSKTPPAQAPPTPPKDSGGGG